LARGIRAGIDGLGRVAVALVLVGICVTACTSSDHGGPTSSSSPPGTLSAPSSLGSSGVDPRAQAAVTAFLGYWSAWTAAFQRPYGPNGKKPTSDEDVSKYSVEPEKRNILSDVFYLATARQAWRGSPPTPRFGVLSIDLAARPLPIVMLTNCPTVGAWRLVSARTGKAIPTVAPSKPDKAKPPYGSVVKVVLYHGDWVVTQVTTDRTQTCRSV
jgi:hypothetical protein